MSTQSNPGQGNGEGMPYSLPIGNDADLTMITAQNVHDFAPEIVKLINGDPDVRANIHWLKFIATEEQVVEHTTSRPEDGEFDYALTVDGRFAGFIGLTQRDEMGNSGPGDEVSMHYFLGAPFRRKGLASRGMQSLMGCAEDALRPSYFTLYISDTNLKSQRVARHNGFVRTKGLYSTDSGAIERRYERRPSSV